ncbi:MAG: hypothetical protein WBY93_14920 [Candidatus Binatus sp.]|jgi:hypothetical protein
MKRRIVTILQAVVLLFAMTAASGCFVGVHGGWDHHHAGWHDR